MNSKRNKLPDHLAIIMDGNGRWAKRRKMPRVIGHRNGVKSLRSTVETCAELGIKVLTVFAFSTENWGRPPKEVNFLMKLLEEYLKKELPALLKNDIKLRLIGNRQRLPEYVQEPLLRALEATRDNARMLLCLAVDYGSRDEIVKACIKMAEEARDKRLRPDEIDEKAVSDRLFTSGLDDPDLIIRTSGELRLSNFLLWQSAYSELYFTETMWPDFSREELLKAFEEYAGRERRLGKV